MFPLIIAAAGIAMNVLSGASKARSDAVTAKYQNQMAAQKARHDARIAEINAQKQAFDTVNNQRALEQQAMSQALQDAAVMAQTRVSHAGSGVAMDSASKYETRANQQFMHVVSMANAEANRVQALENDHMKTLQYRTNAMQSRAGAEASSIVASAINPSKTYFQNLLTGGLMGTAQFGALTGAFTQNQPAQFGGTGGGGGLGQSDRDLLNFAMG